MIPLVTASEPGKAQQRSEMLNRFTVFGYGLRLCLLSMIMASLLENNVREGENPVDISWLQTIWSLSLE